MNINNLVTELALLQSYQKSEEWNANKENIKKDIKHLNNLINNYIKDERVSTSSNKGRNTWS